MDGDGNGPHIEITAFRLFIWTQRAYLHGAVESSRLLGDRVVSPRRPSITRLRAPGWERGGTFGGPASERGLGTAELVGVRPGRSSSQELGRLLVEGPGVFKDTPRPAGVLDAGAPN